MFAQREKLAQQQTFNRTIEELKFFRLHSQSFRLGLLIAPLRN